MILFQPLHLYNIHLCSISIAYVQYVLAYVAFNMHLCSKHYFKSFGVSSFAKTLAEVANYVKSTLWLPIHGSLQNLVPNFVVLLGAARQ